MSSDIDGLQHPVDEDVRVTPRLGHAWSGAVRCGHGRVMCCCAVCWQFVWFVFLVGCCLRQIYIL